MPSTLGYWRIQGLCHPIRFLLKYVEEEFEDKYYIRGPPPEHSKDAWLKEKFNLGLDFPNLPYYIDDKVKLTQSNTILRYLGRKYNVGGETDKERTRIDLVLDQLLDTRVAMAMLLYNPDFENMTKEFVQTFPEKLKLYEDFLGNYPYIGGQKVTIADFPLHAMLKEHQLLAPDCLDDFSKLRAFIDRIENLPQIKKYMESEGYPKLPLLTVKQIVFGQVGW